MMDLEERLHALAGAIDVPPASPHDDLLRGRRRRRRRRQWTVTGVAALAAASTIVALGSGTGSGPGADQVGPAYGPSTAETRTDPELPTTTVDTAPTGAQALDAARELYDLATDRLGLDPQPYRASFSPSYDERGRVEMLVPTLDVQDPRTGRLREVSLRVARTWVVTEWRDYSCHPDCATYDLDGRTVEEGRYSDDQWGWATEHADGTVVVLLLPLPAATLGIERAQIDAVLRGAALPDTVDEPSAWYDRMLDAGLEHFMVGRDSIVTGGIYEASGSTVVATSQIGSADAGDVRWEGELLTTAPTVCPDGERCETRVVDGVPLTIRWIEGGGLDGWAWVEHDGVRVRSRALLEPWGDDLSVPLDRVAALLDDPFWQEMPDSQSVTTG